MMPEEEARRAALEAAHSAREAARHVRDAAVAEARRLREEARKTRDEARREARDVRDDARRHRDALRAEVRAWHGGDSDDDSATGAKIAENFALDGVRTVSIHQTAGRLTVRPCGEGETPGVETASSRSAPSLRVERRGDRLDIEIEISLGRLFRRRQGATTVVRLAPGPRDIRVDAGYGRLDVTDIAGESLSLHVGAGDLAATRTAGRLEADVGAGKIAISGHSGPASCDMGTGDVLLDVAEIERGELRISVGMGQADLRLPAGKRVRASATSGIGKGSVEYPQGGDDAPIRATLNTGVGKAVVRGRETAGPAPAAARPREGSGSPGRRRLESEEVRVLQLLEQGRITSREAAELIAALRGSPPPDDEAATGAEPPGEAHAAKAPEPGDSDEPAAQ
jgi:hypothetical protein